MTYFADNLHTNETETTLLRAGWIRTPRPRRFLLSVCLLLFSFPGPASSEVVRASQRYKPNRHLAGCTRQSRQRGLFRHSRTHQQCSRTPEHRQTRLLPPLCLIEANQWNMHTPSLSWFAKPPQILAWGLSLTSMPRPWDPYPVISSDAGFWPDASDLLHVG